MSDNKNLLSEDQTDDKSVQDPITAEGVKELTPREKLEIARKNLEAKKETKRYYDNQFEILEPQVKLMELRARLSKATYDNYRHSIELNKLQEGFSNQTTNSTESKPEMFDHVVTQEDLDANLEMVSAGLKVGEIIKMTTIADTASGESGNVTTTKIDSTNQTDMENEIYEGGGND